MTPRPHVHLSSGSAGSFGLEDISIRVRYCSRDILLWKDTFDTLLEDEFKNLRNLNIIVVHVSEHEVKKVVELLNDSVYVKRLRVRRNLVVGLRGKYSILSFIILYLVL